MFTGIVEEVGKVIDIKNINDSIEIKIQGNKVLENTVIGDSICTNGVCLTVCSIDKTSFKADIMNETIKRSNLGNLKKGSKVNLERALTLEKRIGGHIVSGHIDGRGKISLIKDDGNATWMYIDANSSILKYIVEKGSIAIDGISLTVAYIDDYKFGVSLIPHTISNTILLDKVVGDDVNLECDITSKYIEKLINYSKNQNKGNINKSYLEKYGFI